MKLQVENLLLNKNVNSTKRKSLFLRLRTLVRMTLRMEVTKSHKVTTVRILVLTPNPTLILNLNLTQKSNLKKELMKRLRSKQKLTQFLIQTKNLMTRLTNKWGERSIKDLLKDLLKKLDMEAKELSKKVSIISSGLFSKVCYYESHNLSSLNISLSCIKDS